MNPSVGQHLMQMNVHVSELLFFIVQISNPCLTSDNTAGVFSTTTAV